MKYFEKKHVYRLLYFVNIQILFIMLICVVEITYEFMKRKFWIPECLYKFHMEK